ncbi:MAG: glycoside hydrolase family 13 protein [Bacteroidia bacterium]
MKQTVRFNGLCLLLPFSLMAQPQVDPLDWAKHAVWYQIFPDRFHNGDPSNDPDVGSQFFAWPHDTLSPWQIHPWGSDWYQMQDWEKENGQDLWYNITRRRYGGDLQGIIDKLDYLQALGINALYLNPIFWSPSHHKYDGMMYHHVDPYLGPDPVGDIALIEQEIFDAPETWQWTAADRLALQLIEACHSRGMRIIFDGVFNHLGVGSPAFQDVIQNQRASPYADWFEIESWDDVQAGTQFSYKGWFGVASLPEIREDSMGIVAGPRAYIYACTRRWMDPDGNGNIAKGIDGWRLDVAFCVAHAFWKDWRILVKSINPAAYLTAEVIDDIDKVKPYLQGDEFDAIMNYNFAFIAADYFVNDKKRIKTTDFDKQLRDLRQAYAPEVAYVQQNLFGSHDANRLASHIVNRDFARYADWGEYFGKSKADNPHYNTRKPTEAEYDIQKLFAVFQFTYVGAPMVYYGDEVGMWGANDPDCRKPMVWKELAYEAERYKADGSRYEQPQLVLVHTDMLAHYQHLSRLRASNPALSTGDFESLLAHNHKQLYAFRRTDPLTGKSLVVILNNSDKTRKFKLKTVRGQGRELYQGATIDSGKRLKASLPAKGFMIYRENPPSK